MKKILLVFGTRPEFIKLIPVILEFRKRKSDNPLIILHTGQHQELVTSLFEISGIYPDYSFNSIVKGQALADSLTSIMNGIETFVTENISRIGFMISQGDTSSCFCASQIAVRFQLPFAHIEAGLRTYHMSYPYPEELFRRIITLSSNIHFAPTSAAYENLVNEGIKTEDVIVTGNTIVDTIRMAQENILFNDGPDPMIKVLAEIKNNVLITCHRRENQNENFITLKETIIDLAIKNPALRFLWISHLTPFIENELDQLKNSCPQNVMILQALPVDDLYHLYKSVKIIITDSGGIQEEAASFGIPVIVIREVTERNESITYNNSKLTGVHPEKIKKSFYEFLDTEIENVPHLYGDGFASKRIVDFFETDRFHCLINEKSGQMV